jgi:hypothetical protein
VPPIAPFLRVGGREKDTSLSANVIGGISLVGGVLIGLLAWIFSKSELLKD